MMEIIHHYVDLTFLNFDLGSVWDVLNYAGWDEFFVPGNVYQIISDCHCIRIGLLKLLQQDSSFLLMNQ